MLRYITYYKRVLRAVAIAVVPMQGQQQRLMLLKYIYQDINGLTTIIIQLQKLTFSANVKVASFNLTIDSFARIRDKGNLLAFISSSTEQKA